MDCEKNIKCLFKSKNEGSNIVIDDIKLQYVLKIKTCSGISDYFVIKSEGLYQLYDLYNKYIPKEIMIEVKEGNSVYYKKIENIKINDINEFKNIYPIVEVIDLEEVEGLDFEQFLQIVKNRE